MKKTIKTLLTTGLLLLFAGNVWALPIKAEDQIHLGTSGGNTPYIMTNLDTEGTWNTYKTFCLESKITFNPSVASYKVQSVSEYATSGGGGNFVAQVGDQIEQETKWLYASYFSEKFTGIANANDLVQKAIWYLEDEVGGLESAWNTLSAVSTTGDYTTLGWDIKAVNLISGSTDVQSQLVGEYAPVPEPATMMLFGIGLLGLASIGRKKQ